MKLSDKQKEVIKTMREYDCGVMKLNDGYWFTGGHGQVDGRIIEALERKGMLDPFKTRQLTELGKTIEL
jgi:ribosomal protein S19E (S16A)